MGRNKNQNAAPEAPPAATPPAPAAPDPAVATAPPEPTPQPAAQPAAEPPAPAAGQDEDVRTIPAGTYTAEELAELARMESEGGPACAASDDTDGGLDDDSEAEAAAAAAQKADELALLGSLTPLERAKLAFGLEDRHILGSGVKELEDGTVQVTIVTQGGQRVRWPQDSGRVLSDMEKGDGEPTPVPAGIMSAKK